MARVDMPAWATKTAQEAMQADVTQIKTGVAALVAKYSQIVVTCETQDDTAVTGQTVTLRAGTSADAPVYDTRAYNGQPVTFEVPRGFRYHVEVSATLAGHYAPTTATGTATTGTVAVVLTYSDIDHITTFPALEAAVRSMSSQAEGRAALVGIEIADTWTDTDGTTVYSDPIIVVDVQPVEDANGAEHLAAILMRKYAAKYDIQFDAPENGPEAYATEETAIGGHYYWGYGKDYAQAPTYAVNAFCGYKGGIWKCTTAVSSAEAFDPMKWSLLDAKYYLDSATYAVGEYAKFAGTVYQCTTAVETAEEFDPAKWTQVLSSGWFQTGARTALNLASGATVPYSAWTLILTNDVNDTNIQTQGYSNYEFSAWSQYLESSAGVGEWWHPSHIGDCPPSQATRIRGYKAGCSNSLLAVAKPIRVPIWPWNKNPQYIVRQFWLPSVTQMFGVANDDEGYEFKEVQDNCKAVSGWTTASNSNTNARVYRRVSATGTSVILHTRSVPRNYSYCGYFINSSGGVSFDAYNTNWNASVSRTGLPMCAIY